MDVTKISSFNNAINFSNIDNASKISIDFKSMLVGEIDSKSTKTYTKEEIDNFVTCKEGMGKWLTFPPEDAPVEFKAIWNDVFRDMYDKKDGMFGVFTADFLDILANGVAYPIEYADSDLRYSSAQARISRLGYAGCVEFAIKAQENHVNANKLGGNEQRFIDVMQITVDKLKEVKSRLQELDDTTINNQINSADREYLMLKAKDKRDWAEISSAMSSGISNEEFQAVLHRIAQRQWQLMKSMADNTLLTTFMTDNEHINNSFRSKNHNIDLLSAI